MFSIVFQELAGSGLPRLTFLCFSSGLQSIGIFSPDVHR